MMKKRESPPSGQELKELRLQYGLTQKQLGEILGVTGVIVDYYETGRIQFPEEHLEELNRLLSASPGSAPKDSAADEFVPQPASEPPERSPEPGSPLASTPSPAEIKALRMEHGLLQKDVADAFGKSQESISAYENGRARVPPGLAECIKGIKVPDAAPSVQPSPEEIRALREKRGLRLKDVAAAFGKSVSAIQTYENGRAPVPPGLAECIEGIKEPIPDDIILPTPAEIKALREERGLSRQAVAEAFGKSAQCIYAYETGRSPVPPGLAECIKGMAEPLPPPDNEAGPPVSPEELLALRTERNLSALKLSKALGISNSSLRNYETGRTPVPKGLAEKIVALFPDVPDLGESPDPTREAFCADDLRKLRLSRNLSRGALAKALGMDAPTIKEYESGQKKIPPGLREKILTLFLAESKPRMTREEFTAYRILNGLTRAEFAAAIGSSAASVGYCERGLGRVSKELERRIKELYPVLDVAPYVARVQALDITVIRPASPVMFLMLRLSRNLSRAELASALGKSERTIERYEQGKTRIPYEIVFRILMMYPEETGMNLSGEDLKDLRLSLDLTRSEFALRFGTAPNIVSNYENGHSDPPEWLVQKIAQSEKLRTYR